MIKHKKWVKKFILNLGVIKFLKKIKDYSAQKRIDKAEIVHIMFNDKFNKLFVDFLNKNFDNSKHLILCKKVSDCEICTFPRGRNVIKIGDIRNIDLSSKKIKKIICHSLFMPDLVEKLYNEPKLLKKSYWVMWGGDLYEADRDEKNDFVRKNFKGYLLVSNKDSNVLTDKYGEVDGRFFDIQYVAITTLPMLEHFKNLNKPKDYYKIQINNSCCETTIDMLDILSKFKNKNIKITTILSYGDLTVKEKIIEKGIEIFGNKFEYMEKMIPPYEFSKHLSSVDILILNQNRQQGLGNINAAFYLGSKVFIKSNISSYLTLKNDFNIFDTNKIKDLTFEEFIENNYKESNNKKSLMFFDDCRIKSLWENVFSY